MIVKPEIVVTPDHPQIYIREPMENVDLSTLLPRVLDAQGWGVGTTFDVLFVSHDRSTLLNRGQFIVAECMSGLQTSEVSTYQTVTKETFRRRIEMIGDWLVPVSVQEAQGSEEAGAPDVAAPEKPNSGPSVRWNPGHKVHEVVTGEGTVVATFSKEDGGKEAAERYIAGSEAA